MPVLSHVEAAPATPAAPPIPVLSTVEVRTACLRRACLEPVERSQVLGFNCALSLRAGGGARAIGRERCDFRSTPRAFARACARVALPTLPTSADLSRRPSPAPCATPPRAPA